MGLFDRSSKKTAKKSHSFPNPKHHPQQFVPSPVQPSASWHQGCPFPEQSPRIAGYLPPPPGWNSESQIAPPVPPRPDQSDRPYGPIVVNMHYHWDGQQPPPHGHSQGHHLPNGHMHNSNATVAGSSRGRFGSAIDLANQVVPGNIVHQVVDDGLPRWHSYGTQVLNSGAALVDQISGKLNDVLTLIDRDTYKGNEQELFMYQTTPVSSAGQLMLPAPDSASGSRDMVVSEGPRQKLSEKERLRIREANANTTATSIVTGTYFSKVELYANSKLPLNLPPLQLYFPTYPLICLAAQYSQRVYEKPNGAERDTHVNADWKSGTKAMCIKSVPMDHMDTIVFAIRGSASFMDWTVNLNSAPASPKGFLDDPTNFCHSGFLSVARRMVSPVASRLKQLLEENPRRASYSLLITGHSAGGAVAALLYSHMLSSSSKCRSDLTRLATRFRRVHCITFGAPPLSLRPLSTHNDYDSSEDIHHRHDNEDHIRREERKRKLKHKSVFLSFINEGDPVTRADVGYVKSLLDLYAAAAPDPVATHQGNKSTRRSSSRDRRRSSGDDEERGTSDKRKKKRSDKDRSSSKKKSKKSSGSGDKDEAERRLTKKKKSSSSSSKSKEPQQPVWTLPPSRLCLAGRLVVLRSGRIITGEAGDVPLTWSKGQKLRRAKTVDERLDEGVVAQMVEDEELKSGEGGGVVWGDPVCHLMKLYAARVEVLAVGAVTGR